MGKKRALVVCPGRGTYNKSELGYFHHHHQQQLKLLSSFDEIRRTNSQEPLTALDQAPKFSIARHTRGDNASGLIFACSMADHLAIDRNAFDIVAVTGNSMGWYSALACAGAMTSLDGFKLVNTMGTLMQESLIGGQLIYPFVDENWMEIPGKREELFKLVEETTDLYVSIFLGGLLVFAGENNVLKALEAKLPRTGQFPLVIPNHAAFHTPLQLPVSVAGQEALPQALFQSAETPLIDGRGHIWYPGQYTSANLRDYTLSWQVTETYDFTRAIQNGLKEFAPDCVIVTGPGNTLGSSVAQSMLQLNWLSMSDKSDFQKRQEENPYLLAMGMAEQRAIATGQSSAD